MRQHTTTITRITAIAATLVAAFLAHSSSAHAGRAVPRTSWAPHIDRTILTLRARAHGRQRATWYGPGFFGRRTACGQTLTRRTWGIAHRVLPCGTLVTLAYRGRKVTVPVIDRGPYSGATVDLTRRTRTFLRFVDGHVRMTEVRRYRVLPRG